jgi:hypothetical protein
MKRRTALLFLAAAAFFAALVGSSYAAGLWTGESPQPAEATPADYGICNVSVGAVPEGVRVAPVPLPRPPGFVNTPTYMSLYLLLSLPVPPDLPRPARNPDTGIDPDLQSRVYIDAATGEVAFENYRTASEEAILKEALASLRVGPWQPTSDVWPRTDTPPKKALREEDDSVTKIQYRPPDDGSGLMLSRPQGDTFSRLTAFTCESVLEIDGVSGEVLRQEVVPQEQAMFGRFLGEVKTK